MLVGEFRQKRLSLSLKSSVSWNDDFTKFQPRMAIASDCNRIRRNRESLTFNVYIRLVTMLIPHY